MWQPILIGLSLYLMLAVIRVEANIRRQHQGKPLTGAKWVRRLAIRLSERERAALEARHRRILSESRAWDAAQSAVSDLEGARDQYDQGQIDAGQFLDAIGACRDALDAWLGELLELEVSGTLPAHACVGERELTNAHHARALSHQRDVEARRALDDSKVSGIAPQGKWARFCYRDGGGCNELREVSNWERRGDMIVGLDLRLGTTQDFHRDRISGWSCSNG